jgi:hypothetical protein
MELAIQTKIELEIFMYSLNLPYSEHDLYRQYVSNHRFEVKMFEQLDPLIMLDAHINVEEIVRVKPVFVQLLRHSFDLDVISTMYVKSE